LSASAGTIVQAATPLFQVDVTVRPADLSKYRNRQDAYSIIARQVREARRSGLSISADELFSNAVCARLGDVPGRRTKQELASRVPDLKNWLMHDLPVASGPLVLLDDPGPGTVEYIGVGVGLTVVDRLMALDASHFRRIESTSSTKTLDFDGVFRASTGTAYVQIEVKGRVDGNNLQAAWEHIDAKKLAFRNGNAPQRGANAPLDPGTPTYLVGAVASIPRGGTQPTLVTIGDPAIPSFDGEPSRAKLLQRLWFYQRALAVFQPRGALLAALSERIGTLTRPEVEWRKFDGQRLFNWRMEEWELAATIADTVRVRRDDQFHGRSVLNRKRTRGSGVEGESPSKAKEPFFFLGLHRDVLLALARQDFKEIADYRYDRRHIRAQIDDLPRLMYQHPSGLIVSAVADVRAIDEGSIRESF
jgi:hypothetical protein